MLWRESVNGWFGGIGPVVRMELRLRVRSFGFWVMMVVFGVLTYLALPPRSAGYSFLTAANQGVFVYDSSFIGMISGFISTLLYGLIGFFVAHNSMRRDRITPVGEVIAATRVTSPGYLFGKYMAVACTLGVFFAVSLITGIIVQLVRREAVVAWSSLLPSAFLLAVPTLLYTAGLGTAAGACPVRGSGGAFNLLYIAYWLSSLWGVLTISFVTIALWIDFTGFIIPSFEVARKYYGSAVLGAAPQNAQLLQWPRLSAELYVLPRVAYATFGPVLVALGLLWFGRFDPARGWRAAKVQTPPKPKVAK